MAFILDNGAYSIKAGYSSDESPIIIPNCIMKAKSERRRPFIGNEIEDCRDASGLFFMLPFTKGYLVNWDIEKTVWDYLLSKDCCSANLSQYPLIITEPIYNFSPIKEAMSEIFFEEYDCQSLLMINPSTLAYHNYTYNKYGKNNDCKACLIVDSGYSFTHIIPYVNGAIYKEGIRRIDVGGKLLTNHLKEVISYRQLHVMDETYVINQVKEDSCFVSQNFMADMELTKNSKLEKNPIVKDYVLPDYTSLRRGYLKDPGHQEEQQTLRMNNERFAIPEILFHPSDVGIKQMGIPEAIMDSIKSCDYDIWPYLLLNIVLIGGNVKFTGFRDRVYNELRALAPDEYNINIFLPSKPDTYPWEGGKVLSNDPTFSSMLMTKEEYEEHGPILACEKF